MFLLISTLRNEAENLPKLIHSIETQSIKPSLWVIMNDNSSDNTEEIIRSSMSHHPYIHLINLEPGDKDLAWRYHRNMKFGFDKAIVIAEEKGIDWDSIGVLDGDIVFEDTEYYEKLENALHADETLGIVSGELSEPVDGVLAVKKRRYPCGACRLIRKECYALSGYPEEPAADSIMRVLASINGFSSMIIPDAKAIQVRETTSFEYDIKSAKYTGYIKYYLGFPPIYALLQSLRLLSKGRIQNSIVFFLSYFRNVLRRNKRVSYPEVKKTYSKAFTGANK